MAAPIDRQAAEAERKKGKWLLKDRDGSWTSWTCSECGRLVHLTDYRENVQKEHPFCPFCGARMVID